MKVHETDPRVSAMQEDWQLVSDLLGGSRAMRQARERYMPRWTLEDKADYDNRLRLATLFPALEHTLKSLTGRVFASELGTDDVEAWITEEVWPNIDKQDSNGHVFAREWWEIGLAKGHALALVESPQAPGVRTQAQQKAEKMRPYCILLTPERVLGWKHAEGRLTQLRVTWSRTEPDEFGEKEIPQIRVYETRPAPKTVWVRVFEKVQRDGKEEWGEVDQIETGVTEIPIAVFYTERTGPLTSRPPLRELAELNRKHWAQQCSTDSLLQTASVPILAAIGIQPDETKISVGAKSAIALPVGADMKFVEHSGKAIGSGRDSLKDLEAQMKAIGAKLVEPGAQTKTATQASEEAASGNSVLAGWVRDFSDAMAALLDLIASYRGEAKGGMVKINADLDPDSVPHETMGVLGRMVATGGLSRQTQFEEAKRRGMISAEVTWDDEQARIQTDGPEPPPGAQP